MKKILTVIIIAISSSGFAQTNTFPSSGSAGIGTTTPNASAALDVTSTSQGVLVPRMTKTQRDAIASPVTGLLIYQTNNTPGFYYYTGSAWTAISAKAPNKNLSNLTEPTAVNVNLLPQADNTIDLGASASSWKDLYVDGIGYLGSAKVGNYTGTAQAGMIRWTGTDFEGYNGTSWISLTATGTTYTAGTGIDITGSTITNTAPTQWNTNGSNISYNSGNVGMGTSSPSQKLEVSGTTKTTNLQITNGATNGFVLQSDASGNASWVNSISLSNGNWTTSGSNQYSALSGNVGIGTTSPNNKLHVYNPSGSVAMKVESGTSSANINLIAGASATEAGIAFLTGTSQRWSFGKSNTAESGSNAGSDFFINRYSDAGTFLSQPFVIKRSSGNVGIGTSSPSQKLEVNGTARTTNFQMTSGATNGFVLQSDAGGNASWVNPTSLPSATWTIGGSNQFSAVSGNVGIGISSPVVKLHLYNGSGNAGLRVESGLGDASLRLVASGSGKEASTALNTGNSQRWSFGKSNTAESGSNAGSDFFINRYDDSGNFLNQPLVIKRSSGDVGIGTSTPTQKLEVNGTTKTTNLSTTTLQMSSGATDGYTLMSDANGNASWVKPDDLFFETVFETSGGGGQTIPAGSFDLLQFCLVVEDLGEITEDTRITATFNITCSDMSTTTITLGSDGLYDGEVSGSNFVNTTFSTHATASITSGSAPYTGTFSAGFSSWIGQVIDNAVVYCGYILSDQTNGTGLTLNSWSFKIERSTSSLWTFSGDDIYNSNSGNVGIGTSSPSHKLQLGSDDAAKPSTSTWTVVSDQRLKTDVHSFTDGWNVLKDVNPVWFTYNGEGGTKKGETSMGTLAQDIEKVAPYMVTHWKYNNERDESTDYLGLNYHALFFLLTNEAKAQHKMVDSLTSVISDLQNNTNISGNSQLENTVNEQKQIISDQQQQIDEMKNEIVSMKDMLSQFESSLSQCCSGLESETHPDQSGSKSGMSDSPALEQNIPNPFTQTSYIKFYIPSSAKDAMIMVSDLNGKVIKQFTKLSTGFGTVNIEAGSLAAGTYQYSLVVNGIVIDTKQMILTK